MAAKNSQFSAQSNYSHHPKESDVARSQRTLLAQAVSTALIAGVASGPLLAQEPALEEIIVTATKRAESIMDVPLAITAISGEAIREINLNDVKDLIHLTPGIAGNSKDSFLDFVNVRGIRTIDFGNGGDPSVSLYKNGLYEGVKQYRARSEGFLRPLQKVFFRLSLCGAFLLSLFASKCSDSPREAAKQHSGDIASVDLFLRRLRGGPRFDILPVRAGKDGFQFLRSGQSD